LENIRITQHYRFYHRGVDFDGITGDPIRPIAAGKVVNISRSFWAYGNSIIVEHKSGARSLYAHLSKFNVKEGDEVNKNTIIGEVGSTGRSFGDHLHLEVYDENGNNVNPLEYLSD
jgi:murein DD-endopeptidase MepM/ murein hydrolase activator NlpD